MTHTKSTAPRPYVFVLMPLAAEFDDIYKFGIKDAAEDVGAFADRIDEQIFQEGILERIFTQIAKADVVVADMTGRNANVFYEVGYAHALGKIVLLLTQNADDIPFDLKHRQHTVYGGKIELLRKDLTTKLRWAISEGRRLAAQSPLEHFSLRVMGVSIPEDVNEESLPRLAGEIQDSQFLVPVHVRNDSFQAVGPVSHVYLFVRPDSSLVTWKPSVWSGYQGGLLRTTYSVGSQGDEQMHPIIATSLDAPDGLTNQYRLAVEVPALPAGAVEELHLPLMLKDPASEAVEVLRLRLHTTTRYHDFRFEMGIRRKTDGPK